VWRTQNNDGLEVIAAADSEYNIPVAAAGAQPAPGLGQTPRAAYNDPARFSGFVPWTTADGYVMECQRCLCKVRARSVCMLATFLLLVAHMCRVWSVCRWKRRAGL
jgi:hypothetical protein